MAVSKKRKHTDEAGRPNHNPSTSNSLPQSALARRRAAVLELKQPESIDETAPMLEVPLDETSNSSTESFEDEDPDVLIETFGATDRPKFSRYFATPLSGTTLDTESTENLVDGAKRPAKTTPWPVHRVEPPIEDVPWASKFSPRLGQNVIKTQTGFQIKLMAEESFSLHGIAELVILSGAVNLNGAILTQFDRPIKIFAPGVHPLPIITARSHGQRTQGVVQLTDTITTITSTDVVLEVSSCHMGLEGIEQPCRLAGLLSRTESMWGRRTEGDPWSNETFNLIFEPQPNLRFLRLSKGWTEFVDTLIPSEMGTSNEREEAPRRFVMMVQGAKRAGKSTMAIIVLNRLLACYRRVAFVDCDLGQGEFAPPGMVALHLINRPVIGPAFTHPRLPFRAHFLGSTSPQANPSRYLTAVTDLINAYDFEVASATDPDTVVDVLDDRIDDRVPLIINTQGWVKGLGADLLTRLGEVAHPTHVVSLESPDYETALPTPVAPTVIRLPSVRDPSPRRLLAPVDLRSLNLLAYFHTNFSEHPLDPTWDFNLPLIARRPRSLDWSKRRFQGGFIDSVHILHHQIDPAHVLYALNASIVALVETDDDQGSDGSVGFPFQSTTPQPSSSFRCRGLALIRAVNGTTSTMHILSPLPDDILGRCSALVKGMIELPTMAMIDYRPGQLSNRMVGMDWSSVPYLTAQSSGMIGGAKRRIRRNVQRR